MCELLTERRAEWMQLDISQSQNATLCMLYKPTVFLSQRLSGTTGWATDLMPRRISDVHIEWPFISRNRSIRYGKPLYQSLMILAKLPAAECFSDALTVRRINIGPRYYKRHRKVRNTHAKDCSILLAFTASLPLCKIDKSHRICRLFNILSVQKCKNFSEIILKIYCKSNSQIKRGKVYLGIAVRTRLWETR